MINKAEFFQLPGSRNKIFNHGVPVERLISSQDYLQRSVCTHFVCSFRFVYFSSVDGVRIPYPSYGIYDRRFSLRFWYNGIVKAKTTASSKLFWVIVASILLVMIVLLTGAAITKKMRSDSIDCNKMRRLQEDGDRRGTPVNFSSDVVDKCFKD